MNKNLIKKFYVAIILLTFFSIGSQKILASTILVPDDYTTIQAAIDAASDGDTVSVSPETYLENIDFKGKNITVGSLFLTTGDESYISQTVIDGGHVSVVVTFENDETNSARLTGFTIRGGHGGGIYCYSSNPSIDNLIITHNYAELRGGGIYIESGSPILNKLTIEENLARDGQGGGVYNNGGNLILKNSIIRNNECGSSGGGIYIIGGSTILNKLTIEENISDGDGGGVYIQGGNLILKNSIIRNNECESFGGSFPTGCGIRCRDTDGLTFKNLLIYGNWTSDVAMNPPWIYLEIWRNGISLTNSNPTMVNVTITENEGSWISIGIICSNSNPTLVNSIVTLGVCTLGSTGEWGGNHPIWFRDGRIWHGDESSPNSITISYSDIERGQEGIYTNNNGTVYWGDGNIDSDPLFSDAANGDYHLAGGSPCIDTGTSFEAPSTDLEGTARPQGSGYDMGAYEAYLPVALIPYTPDPTNDNTPTLGWNDVGGANSYTLQYSDQSDFSTTNEVTGLTESQYSVPDELSDGTWYWRVKAYDSSGDGGGWSFADSFEVDTQAPTASASPEGGSYSVGVNVTLSADEEADIYYTTDGSTPATNSTKYHSEIAITETTALKFIAIDKAGNESQVYTETYIIMFTISGQVKDSWGQGIEGVTITFSNEAGTATTDDQGNYSQTVNFGWSGTATPSKTGHTFSPTSLTYSSVADNQVDQDYTAILLTYTISGTVSIGGTSTGLSGVEMSGLPGDPQTNEGGNYSATVDYDWSGTAIPTTEGYTFSPPSRTYANVTSDQTNQDYTATINTYTLTTSVNPSGGGSIATNPDKTSYTHGENVTLTASANTGYAFFGWTGDVPLGHENDNPLSITMDSDKTLTAHLKTYTISGTVKSTEGISEVTITFSNEGGTVTTDPNGNYSHQVFYGWTGTATPSKVGYIFSPSSRGYTNVTSDRTAQDYTAILNTYILTTQVNTSVGGFITKNPDKAFYNHGDTVDLTANANTGYTFTGWTGDIPSGHEGDSPITITMDADKSIMANFSAVTGETGKKDGCFIATAAYGSPLHSYVRILRDFRDKYLMPSKLGRALVDIYYKYSPSVADFIMKHKVLKVAVRFSLLPVIVFSYSMLHFGPIITTIMLVFIFMLPIVLISY